MVTIATGNSREADMMRAFLESQGVSVFLRGEFLGSVAPHVAAPGGAGAVQIQVPEGQEEAARRLLREKP